MTGSGSSGGRIDSAAGSDHGFVIAWRQRQFTVLASARAKQRMTLPPNTIQRYRIEG